MIQNWYPKLNPWSSMGNRGTITSSCCRTPISDQLIHASKTSVIIWKGIRTHNKDIMVLSYGDKLQLKVYT